MAGIPITIEATQGDTRPVCEWQIKDTNDNIIDLTAAAKTVELYYRISGDTVTQWKITLTKSDAPNGKVQYTPDGSHPYYPAASTTPVQCEGELRYQDSAASPAIDVRIRSTLVTAVHPKFPEP